MLLSSQPSGGVLHVIRRPSAHVGAHVSKPPTPEPPSAAALETHVKPTSKAHSAEQPSPPAVLLSSHASAVVRTPSPQMCTGATKLIASASSVPLTTAASSAEVVTTDEVSASSVRSSGSYGDSPALVVSTPKLSSSSPSRRRLSSPPGRLSPLASTVTAGCGPMCAGLPSA